MSDVTLTWGGKTAAAVRADLGFARIGNWTAHAETDGQDVPEGACTLTWLGTACAGYVLRAGESEGRVTALIVGGSGGLAGETLTAKHYSSCAVGLPLREALAEAGETLSATSTTSVLATQLTSWPRLARTAGAELDALAAAVGAIWRVLPDGSIFFGVESWPGLRWTDYTLVREDDAAACSWLVPDTLGVLPGDELTLGAARRVGHVLYEISSQASRARLWWQADESTEDPLRQGLAELIDERIVLAGVDYLALYPAQVVTQRADGTVDLTPDSDRIPPPTSVPLRGPCPGAKITVAGGARGYLGFDSRDLRSAYFALYEASGSGHKAVGRVDDICGYLVVTTGPLGLGNAPVVVSVAWSAVLVPSVGLVVCTPIKITSGSPHLSLLPGSTP